MRSPSRRKSAWNQLSSWLFWAFWENARVEISHKRTATMERIDLPPLTSSATCSWRAFPGFFCAPLPRVLLLAFRTFVGDGGDLDYAFAFRSAARAFSIGVCVMDCFGYFADVGGCFAFGLDSFDIGVDFVAIAQRKLAFRFPHMFDLRLQQGSHRAIGVVRIFGSRYVDESHL